MKRVSAVLFGLVVFYMAPTASSAKGDMVLIEIKGETLTTPIKITDPRIQEFNVWSGPGVNGTRLENARGFIIDWQSGVVPRLPAGLQRHEVSFYAGCNTIPDDPRCLAEKPQLAYVVSYDYDPLSKRGFVYLPRRGEPWFEVNGGTIWHGSGIEGHWFFATDSWENFVRPLIAKAMALGPTH
jgi:hypothetical protein